jgi:hypothetical protein
MMFLKCEWFDYDFEVVIFPKDIDKYKDKVDIDKIIIVNGNLGINFEYARKSVQARDIKVATIWMIREQAKDLWIFDSSKRFVNKNLNEIKEEDTKQDSLETCNNDCEKNPENFEDSLEEKIIKNKTEKEDKFLDKYVIDIPKYAKKEDLHELKEFLNKEKQWFTKIFINFNWNEIDTKSQLENLDNLIKWIEKKWL